MFNGSPLVRRLRERVNMKKTRFVSCDDGLGIVLQLGEIQAADGT